MLKSLFGNNAVTMANDIAAGNASWSDVANDRYSGQQSNAALGDILGTYLSAMSSSAIEAEKAAALSANQFAASQAALDREFQQTSAERAMNFSAEEAAKNRDWQEQQNAKAMQFSADEATRAMDFSERMSSTQYQRAVQDLQAAGLNPLLAYANLSGSSPAGYAGTGYTSSGSSGTGYTSSGSRASATKPNVSAAKEADYKAFDKAISTIALGISSAKTMYSLVAG